MIYQTNSYIFFAKWKKRHLFHYCTNFQDIWNQVQIYFTGCFHFSRLTPQTTIFGFHNINDTFLIQNHILLLFKLHIYNARKYGFLSFNNFLNEINKFKHLKKDLLQIIGINVEDLERNDKE